MSKLRELETALSYTFSDIAFLEQAMVHRSYGAEFPGYESNERFEFLGDTVLQLIVTDFIFHEYPDLPEGELAKIRAASVNRTILFEIARELGPGKTIVTMLCDYGSRYQSKLFNPAFLREKNLPVPAWLDAEPRLLPTVFED